MTETVKLQRQRFSRSLAAFRVVLSVVLSLSLCAPAMAWFEPYEPNVMVSDPYVELRSGPGRGFPIFYVAGQGDEITMLKRKTSWFKVRTPRGKEGWVHIDQMQHTLNLDGEPIDFGLLALGDFSKRRWEFGMGGGDFGGASTISGYLGFALTPNISLQLEGTQILGNFSDGLMANANIVMYPFPKWRISPYFTIGTGVIKTEPQSTIVQAEDRQDEIAHAGVGANIYISDRFIWRMEYKRHTVLTSRDDNEEINQWKTGFSVFF
ncbi:MAG: SH3 domain-containing protein [Pseudomonadales bacterium]